jgi:hypothetical protein
MPMHSSADVWMGIMIRDRKISKRMRALAHTYRTYDVIPSLYSYGWYMAAA